PYDSNRWRCKLVTACNHTFVIISQTARLRTHVYWDIVASIIKEIRKLDLLPGRGTFLKSQFQLFCMKTHHRIKYIFLDLQISI
ncbi:hypothetical protein L9F63_008143, partial [Diploptera punctata]